jgi:hypothetical protein
MSITNAATEVQTFIAAAKSQGASDEILVSLLRDRGWPERLIYDALAGYYEDRTGMPIPARGATGGAAKDTFVYLLSLITLGIWTCSAASILFTVIDRWFPDPALTSSYSYQVSSLAWQMASIIVAFPIYLWLMRVLLTDIEAHPEKSFSAVRKWFTYLALFITAFVLVGGRHHRPGSLPARRTDDAVCHESDNHLLRLGIDLLVLQRSPDLPNF